MKKAKLILCGLMFLLCSACYQAKEIYTLNPDGTGKVQFDYLIMAPSLGINNEQLSLEENLKRVIYEFLSQSKGVSAWKDIVYRWNEDGRAKISGAAYFQKLESLKLGNSTLSFYPAFTAGTDGTGLLQMAWKKDGNLVSQSPKMKIDTDEDLQKEILKAKVKYTQIKMSFSLGFSSMIKDATFIVPGKIQSIKNFSKVNNKSISIHWDGAQFFKLIDGIMNDDIRLRELIRNGINPLEGDPGLQPEIVKTMFGAEPPIEAKITLVKEPFFNYEKEVKEAKPESEKLLNSIKPAAVMSESQNKSEGPARPFLTGEGFTSLQVVGIRWTKNCGDAMMNPFNNFPGLAIALLGEMPGAVLNFKEGKLDTVINGDGEDLLENREDWKRAISFPVYNKKTNQVLFDVNMNTPRKELKELKELSGTLTYCVGKETKAVKTGILEFKEGVQSKIYDLKITSLRNDLPAAGSQYLQLQFSLPSEQILDVTFFEENGAIIPAKFSGSSSSQTSSSRSYTMKGEKFPKKGSVEFLIYDDMKFFTIPFSLKNVPLQLKPEEAK